MQLLQMRRKILVCVFANDLQTLHALYLSNGIYIISGVFMFMEVLCIHSFKHVS
jgi:hypothetical protein